MAGTIITVAQQKGGAGKTTLTAHLAVAFKDAGKSVALVDIDPQQSLSNWFRLRKELYEDAEDGIRDRSPSRGLGDVYKRQFLGQGHAVFGEGFLQVP